jgi:hypothetical protein
MQMNNYQRNVAITIMTEPVPAPLQYYKEKLKAFVRPLLRKIDGKKPLVKPKYGGHYAVTRSFIEGLKREKIPFVYNPQKKKECTEEVIVLAGLNTLRQALEWRKEGVIKKLAAGPNLLNLPSDCPELLSSEYLDTLILNSEWIKIPYCIEMPQLAAKTVIWPAGVDEVYWSPVSIAKSKTNILFYNKRPEAQMYQDCLSIAQGLGLTVTEIKYGSYSAEEYKKALDENSLLVHFVEQETQGISVLEAWAMNIPTIIWNPGFFYIKGMNIVCSSSPNMTDKTGLFFRDSNEFKTVLLQWINGQTAFSPRECVLQHMTDPFTSKQLLQLVYQSWKK